MVNSHLIWIYINCILVKLTLSNCHVLVSMTLWNSSNKVILVQLIVFAGNALGRALAIASLWVTFRITVMKDFLAAVNSCPQKILLKRSIFICSIIQCGYRCFRVTSWYAVYIWEVLKAGIEGTATVVSICIQCRRSRWRLGVRKDKGILWSSLLRQSWESWWGTRRPQADWIGCCAIEYQLPLL